MDTSKLEYGQWCTIGVSRYMITDWTKNTITVWFDGASRTFAKEVCSNVSDFMQTERERSLMLRKAEFDAIAREDREYEYKRLEALEADDRESRNI